MQTPTESEYIAATIALGMFAVVLILSAFAAAYLLIERVIAPKIKSLFH